MMSMMMMKFGKKKERDDVSHLTSESDDSNKENA
jgi:hypothetical protein